MINLNFDGKTAVVTGASRGIGKEISEQLLSTGCKVIITSTKKKPEWISKYNGVKHITLDFLNSNSIESFIYELSRIESIDILVNNAGIHIPQPIDEVKLDDWDSIMKINLYGPMILMKHITQKMKNKGGKILNISSIAGIVSKPQSCSYSASKSGLIGLTRSCAIDMAKHNILVNALCPGTTQTDMVNSLLSEKQKEQFMQNIPLYRFAEPKEIAHFVLFLISDHNTYITGQTIIVDGGTVIQ